MAPLSCSAELGPCCLAGCSAGIASSCFVGARGGAGRLGLSGSRYLLPGVVQADPPLDETDVEMCGFGLSLTFIFLLWESAILAEVLGDEVEQAEGCKGPLQQLLCPPVRAHCPEGRMESSDVNMPHTAGASRMRAPAS